VRAQRQAFPADAKKKRKSNGKLRKHNQQKAAQVRRERKQSTARAQQKISPHAAQKTKDYEICPKPNRRPRKRNSDTKIAQALAPRNKKVQLPEPKKIITCHHRPNKKVRKPNRKPRKPKSNKKLLKPDAKQNDQPREPNKALSFAPLKQKTAKAQQQTPKAQLGHKNLSSRAQQKVFLSPPCHKNCETPTGCLESPTPTKNWASPTRNKNVNATSSTKFFSKRQKPKKTKFPQAQQKIVPAAAETETKNCDSQTKNYAIPTKPKKK
jgi:hypothetical protein